MKICSGCGKTKPLTEFAWRSKAKGTLQGRCKQCHRDYTRNHYNSNTQYYLDKAKRNGKLNREANKALVIDFLKNNPCVDCGEPDLDVLEFDHREMVGTGAPRVSNLIGYSPERLLQEMAKCDVRCANCHAKRTRRMLGTSRYN